AISQGIAIGRAFVFRKAGSYTGNITGNCKTEISVETDKFSKAVENAAAELRTLVNTPEANLTSEEKSILETQIEFISDEQLRIDVEAKIISCNIPASEAVKIAISEMSEMFLATNDNYLIARISDLRDAGDRITGYLLNRNTNRINVTAENTVLIAEEITPVEAMSIDYRLVSGIVTMKGDKTSHASIIIRSKGIPSVSRFEENIMSVNNNETVIVDGTSGDIIISPDEETLNIYGNKKKEYDAEAEYLKSLRSKPAITTDGRKIHLLANISCSEEIEFMVKNGGEGVGLLRTELFFMAQNEFPSEEKQYGFYVQAAIAAGKKPVSIRTLDIGGDKQLPYFPIPPEDNPFLGYRAIRISLDRKEIFTTQIRALLRASAYGNIRILLPMISNIDEIREARAIISKARADLSQSGISFNNSIETGIMIEVPSAAIMTDILANEADFFSIGTNDLIQYSMAADRMNSKVAPLYDHFNPGFLRLLETSISQAHKCNKPVGVCGEMAADPVAAQLLIGMGIDELSVAPAMLPVIKNITLHANYRRAKEICGKVLQIDSSNCIREFLKKELI
ncbi:MAG: phosphoenolpyruvate--protein phosphotransferase, partial [Bacteroidales bacterium]|nr:phosphoenolpyruvate--protein phosphotransferase [Bacteroidales bacterium]